MKCLQSTSAERPPREVALVALELRRTYSRSKLSTIWALASMNGRSMLTVSAVMPPEVFSSKASSISSFPGRVRERAESVLDDALRSSRTLPGHACWRSRSRLLARDLEGAAQAAREVLDEQRDVVGPLAQRGTCMRTTASR